MKKICFVAGHSGGHIIPCMTLAHQQQPSTIIGITTNNGFDAQIIRNAHVQKILGLPLQKIPHSWYQYPFFIIKLLYTFVRSYIFLIREKPSLLITTGGLIAIPACIAARCLRIPVELYELNVEPGKTITLLARLFKKVNICFAQTKNYLSRNECAIVPYPVRFTQQHYAEQQSILKNLNFDPLKKTILILGGSQGSLWLNNFFKDFITTYTNNDIQVIHQIGINDNHDWKQFYQQKNISAIVFDYYHHIENYYQAADLIICRAGAGTLAEIAYFNKTCIVVPLQTKQTNHQRLNAQTFAQKNPAFTYIDQQELTPNLLQKKLDEL